MRKSQRLKRPSGFRLGPVHMGFDSFNKSGGRLSLYGVSFGGFGIRFGVTKPLKPPVKRRTRESGQRSLPLSVESTGAGTAPSSSGLKEPAS